MVMVFNKMRASFLLLLVLILGQYIVFTPMANSANYDLVEPAEFAEYKETLVLTNATELIAALNYTYALSLAKTQVATLSEKLESLYLQLFPNGTFHELEPFLLKVNDELNLNLSVDNIRMFGDVFWSGVENAKEQMKESFSQDVPTPSTSTFTLPREESAPYLHGRSLIAAILVDDASPRVGWNWISEGILRFKIGVAMRYLEVKAPKEAKTSFLGGIFHTEVSSIIDSPGTWMDEAVKNLGYYNVHDMAKKLKSGSGVDNVVLIFTLHKSFIRCGGMRCAGCALPAPYWGYGERACVCFFLIDSFGIGIPNPFSVYVHEILHLFGAVDEYRLPRQQEPSEPWMAYPPLGEFWPNKGWPFSICVMCSPLFFWFRMCTWTRGQIGWNDYDGDGILDPVDSDPISPYRPWVYIFDVPANGYHEVEVDINLTDVIVVGDFSPLVRTLTYPQPYVNFYVSDPNGDIIIQASETLNYSFSFNASTTGAYRFRFENPTETPIYSMRLRLALFVTLPVLAEPEPLRVFSLNLTICDEDGRVLFGIPFSVVSSTADYSASQLTNLNGELNLWLPEGSYSVKATYINSTILDIEVNVNSNISKILYVISVSEAEAIASLEEIPPKHVTLSSEGFGYCGYSDDLVSINLTSANPELYPGDTLTLDTRVEAKTNVYFSYLKLDVYGVKEAHGEYINDHVGSLTILSDVGMASGVVRTENFKLAIPENVLPGALHSLVSAVFAEGEKKGDLVTVVIPLTRLYDVFTIAYLKNRAYELLQDEVNYLNSKLGELETEIGDLQANYNALMHEHEVALGELNTVKLLIYVLIMTTVAFMATTVYLTKRRPKVA
jgi:hypothetical protein